MSSLDAAEEDEDKFDGFEARMERSIPSLRTLGFPTDRSLGRLRHMVFSPGVSEFCTETSFARTFARVSGTTYGAPGVTAETSGTAVDTSGDVVGSSRGTVSIPGAVDGTPEDTTCAFVDTAGSFGATTGISAVTVDTPGTTDEAFESTAAASVGAACASSGKTPDDPGVTTDTSGGPGGTAQAVVATSSGLDADPKEQKNSGGTSPRSLGLVTGTEGTALGRSRLFPPKKEKKAES